MGSREIEPKIPVEGEIPIGKRIRIRRHFMGISRREFADLLGKYSPSRVTQIEFSNKVPEHLFGKIIEILEISKKDLLEAPRSLLEEWLKSAQDNTKLKNLKIENIQARTSDNIDESLSARRAERSFYREDLLKALEWHQQRTDEIKKQLLDLESK